MIPRAAVRDNPINWELINIEYYVRDISGKEIAVYTGSNIELWNLYGLDNIGKMNADTTKYYYIKDHLGTIRAVVNSVNYVISSQDLDCWGYQLQDRSYDVGATQRYKFTSKERDNESNYDYFACLHVAVSAKAGGKIL